jgi:hypothetical protein
MRTTLKLISILSFSVIAAATACSSNNDNGKDSGTGDAATPTEGGKKLDSGTQDTGTGDASATCTADATYSGAITGQTAVYYPTPADAGADAGPEDSYQLQGAYNTDQDLFDIEIYDGYGAFTNGVQAGTYTLTGDDLNYGTCGLCVLIYADANGQSADPYMATAGSITITSISPTGTFAGSGTNLTFTHVSIDQNSLQSTPVGDGCNSAISSVSFSATVTQGQ